MKASEKEMGGIDLPFEDLVKRPDMTVQDKFPVGNGATVRASISLRGLGAAGGGQQTTLPQR